MIKSLIYYEENRRMINCVEESIEEISQWDNLLKGSSTATFFQTKKWLLLWQNYFKAKALILAVYEDKQLIGLAPLSIINKKINFLGVTPVLDKELVTDFGDIICKEGFEKKVWQEILNYLKNNFPDKKIEFWFVRENSPSLEILKSLGGEASILEVSPFLILPRSWNDYLNNLKRKDRRELKRKIKRLRLNDFKIEWVKKIGKKTIKDFLVLMKKSKKEKDAFLSATMAAYFKVMIQNFKDTLIIGFLKLEGENIASVLAFCYQEDLLLYNSGFDPKFKYLSPGLLLKAFLIRYAIQKKFKSFDFLRGNERYKYNLGAIDRNLYKVIL